MKRPQMKLIVSATLTALAVAYGPCAYAVDGDDGQLFLKNLMYTPDKLSEFANVQMMRFYVPSQNNAGALVPVVYKRPDGGILGTRNMAKPLVAAFNDGTVVDPSWTNPVTGETFEPAFAGHGQRDVFSQISLDDGNSWRRGNLSASGTSVVGPIFVVDHTGKHVCDTDGLSGSAVQDLLNNPTVEKCDYFYYGPSTEVPDPTPRDINPLTGRYEIDDQHLVEVNSDGGGDVVNVSQAVVGNHVLVAWVSRMCVGGTSPLDTIESGGNPYDVLGNQKYVDYGVFKAEGEIGTSMLQAIREIGKVPYSCVWTRRGRIVENTATTPSTSTIQWWPAERLTSGVRDAWKIEVAGTENAGFAVVWQEDPDGLLPGSGEGPGEGWSGSTVNHKTDSWYSFLHLKNFANPGPVMSVPVPITDNAKCPLNSGEQGKQWCYADNMTFNKVTHEWSPGSDGLPDLCADGDLIYNSCIAQDGRFMEGQTGASRPRVNLQAYCIGDNDPANWATNCTDYSEWSAWAAISYEESKGKGDLVDEHGQTLETGKNIRFATFDFQQPEPVKQHLQLNAPTKRWPGRDWSALPYIYNSSTPGVIPDTVNPAQPVYDQFQVYRPNLFDISIWNAPFFDTEIARRASITSQGVNGALNSTSKTTLLGIFKQGLINQGGSADIMFRRFVLPDGFAAGSDNIFSNMVCNRWATDLELGKLDNPDMPNVNGLRNPNYQDGLCLEPPHNASGNTPTTCDGVTVADPTGVACGYTVTNPFIYSPTAVVKRMFTWTQSQGAQVSDPLVDDATTNVDDESWNNPWDVAKGHRGILDGDFVMMQYAWAPNEYANAVGRDTYNLYIRRSFDGGQTWTTTPAALGGDGTQNCETYRWPVDGDSGVPGVFPRNPICASLAAGAYEPGRNLSLITSKVAPGSYPLRTVLDPRYTPTGGLLKHANTDFRLSGSSIVAPTVPHDASWGDTRDRSIYFIAYDDGDNRTVAGGAEAEPLDMYYTQAYNWGDDYTGMTYTYPASGSYPGATVTLLQRLNIVGTNASESSITANPGGEFMYSVWNQWRFTDPTDYTDGSYDSEVTDEDPMFRRLLFIDGQ